MSAHRWRANGRLLAVLLPKYRRRLAAVAVLSTLGAALEAIALVLIVRASVAMSQDRSVAQVDPFVIKEARISVVLGIAASVALIVMLLHILLARSEANITGDALGHARLAVIRSFFRASWPTQASRAESAVQDLVGTDALLSAQFAFFCAAALSAVISFAILLISAIVLAPVIASGIVVGVLLLVTAMRPLSAIAHARRADFRKTAGRFTKRTTELVNLGQEVRSFGVTEPVITHLSSVANESRRAFLGGRFAMRLATHLYKDLALLLIVGSVGLVSVLGGSIGSIGAAILLVVRALVYAQQANSYYQAMNEHEPHVAGLARTVEQLDAARASDEGLDPGPLREIRAERVSYEYPGRVTALNELTFTLTRGETVGVVGPSGSGKSTLLQLLLLLRKPTSGNLWVNGRDSREIRPGSWYRRIAFVPQDSRLFDATIDENIEFFRSYLTRDRIEAAAREAHIATEIEGMPDSFHTILGPRGGRVSGGQRQRIALARALAGGPELLVLDEPTSALDPKSEALVQETLRAIRGHAITIVVAHRLSTLSICDRIMVMIDGEIRAFAPSEELARDSGFFREALSIADVH